jgi:hypothetical protein
MKTTIYGWSIRGRLQPEVVAKVVNRMVMASLLTLYAIWQIDTTGDCHEDRYQIHLLWSWTRRRSRLGVRSVCRLGD